MERVIGIGVSKARLDVHSLADGRRLAVGIEAAGIAALADRLDLGAGDLLVTETSGGYERLPHRLLSGRCVRVAVVNAVRVRDFGRASGRRLAKTDRLDAELFARPAPTPVVTGPRQALAELLAYRRQLNAEITARVQQLGHLQTPAVRDRAAAALGRLREERREVEAPARRVIADDSGLAALFALLTGMPGVGLILWRPRFRPNCPSSAPSTGARSPASPGWRRSPATAARGGAAA